MPLLDGAQGGDPQRDRRDQEHGRPSRRLVDRGRLPVALRRRHAVGAPRHRGHRVDEQAGAHPAQGRDRRRRAAAGRAAAPLGSRRAARLIAAARARLARRRAAAYPRAPRIRLLRATSSRRLTTALRCLRLAMSRWPSLQPKLERSFDDDREAPGSRRGARAPRPCSHRSPRRRRVTPRRARCSTPPTARRATATAARATARWATR